MIDFQEGASLSSVVVGRRWGGLGGSLLHVRRRAAGAGTHPTVQVVFDAATIPRLHSANSAAHPPGCTNGLDLMLIYIAPPRAPRLDYDDVGSL